MADGFREGEKTNNRLWRLVIILIFTVGISLVALTAFSQIFPFSAEPESVPVPLDSGLVADYGADPRTFRIPAMRPGIITDIARDRETEISPRHATLIANILTPDIPAPLPTPTPSPAPVDASRPPTDEPPPPPSTLFANPASSSSTIRVTILPPPPPSPLTMVV